MPNFPRPATSAPVCFDSSHEHANSFTASECGIAQANAIEAAKRAKLSPAQATMLRGYAAGDKYVAGRDATLRCLRERGLIALNREHGTYYVATAAGRAWIDANAPRTAAADVETVTVKPLTDTTAETLAALAVIDAEATRRESATAEPQYVTVTDEQGVIWHLTDADGQPVEAGEYIAKDGDRFTIAEHPEAYFGLGVNEAPRTVDITWQTICGKPRSKRQSGVFGAYVDMIMDGWSWTPEFA